MPKYKDKSRKLARQLYWEKHDRGQYQCPDCGRREGQIVGRFEVHHKNGEPMDNRPENHIALCRLCHNLAESKKPDKRRIEKLRDQLSKNWKDSCPAGAGAPIVSEQRARNIPMEVELFVKEYMHEATDQPYANPLSLWWREYDRHFGTESITKLSLINGIEEFSEGSVRFEDNRVSVWNLQLQEP